MSHIKRVVWIGLGVLGFGLMLCLCGSSFTTQWQSIGDGAWTGASNPPSALAYRTLGNATLLFGFLILANAGRTWLNAREQDAVKLRAP